MSNTEDGGVTPAPQQSGEELVAPHLAPVVLLEEAIEKAGPKRINRHSRSCEIIIQILAYLGVICRMQQVKEAHAREIEARLLQIGEALPSEGEMRKQVAQTLSTFRSNQDIVGAAARKLHIETTWPRDPRPGDDVAKMDRKGIFPINEGGVDTDNA